MAYCMVAPEPEGGPAAAIAEQAVGRDRSAPPPATDAYVTEPGRAGLLKSTVPPTLRVTAARVSVVAGVVSLTVDSPALTAKPFMVWATDAVNVPPATTNWLLVLNEPVSESVPALTVVVPV